MPRSRERSARSAPSAIRNGIPTSNTRSNSLDRRGRPTLPAPQHDRSTHMPGPLDGVRVLDFTIFQQGPQATLVMADMGAGVIKVEPPKFGDLGRVLSRLGPHQISAYHLAHSRGKRSITVNLKSDAGREIVRKLIPQSDVMVHNFRPGVMEKLGLGYDDVRALNEGIIYGHASGWGA